MNSPTLFIDSGAHGLYNDYVIKKNHAAGYSDYRKADFWKYVDDYAAFIRNHQLQIYANVDAIFNPKISWRVQKYLEDQHGLSPIPVIHYGTDMYWLEKYLNDGYEYIALGGLGQEATKRQYITWANQAFDLICNQPSRLPVCKVHGFAMTSPTLMVKYPWYSVDSTSWLKLGGYGKIIIPNLKNNKWDYLSMYHVVKITARPSSTGGHRFNINSQVGRIVSKYIEEKGFIIGSSTFKKVQSNYVLKKGEKVFSKNEIEIVEELGLCNDDKQRIELNGLYFLELTKSLPVWPWPFLISNKTLL